MLMCSIGRDLSIPSMEKKFLLLRDPFWVGVVWCLVVATGRLAERTGRGMQERKFSAWRTAAHATRLVLLERQPSHSISISSIRPK